MADQGLTINRSPRGISELFTALFGEMSPSVNKRATNWFVKSQADERGEKIPGVNAPAIEGPTIGPYKPTVRDQIANAVLPERPAPATTRLVEGVLGSRGLGTTGVSAADFTPLGTAFGVNEAESVQDAALAALPFPPAAKRIMPIKSWHGSMKDFDKFDLSHQQSHSPEWAGEGVYSSKQQGVGKEYAGQVHGIPPESQGILYELNTHVDPKELFNVVGNRESKLVQTPANRRAVSSLLDLYGGEGKVMKAHDDFSEAWSRGEYNELPPEVALGDMIKGRDEPSRFLYNIMQSDSKRATQALKDAKIPGVKFNEEGMGGSDIPWQTNYSIFNPDDIEIVKKYGPRGILSK